MIDPLVGLDRIEEAPIDRSLPQRGDGLQETRSPFRVAIRHRSAPETRPLLRDGRTFPCRHALEEGGLVEQGMADSTVAPVEQHQPLHGPAHVSRVEVAVDEGRRDPAGLDRGEPFVEAGEQSLQPLNDAALELVAVRATTSAASAVSGADLQSGRPSVRSSSTRPVHSACSPTRMRTIVRSGSPTVS